MRSVAAPAVSAPAPARAAERAAMLSLIAGAVGIGFAPILAQLAIAADRAATGDMLSPSAVGFWRMALATPVFLWLTRAQGRAGGKPARGAAALALAVPGFFFALDIALWHWSFQFTTVANATLATNMATVIVPVMGWRLLGERVSWLFPVGAVLALLGMGHLVGFHPGAAPEAWKGDMLGLASAFAYASYLIASKRLLRRHPAHLVMAAATATAGIFLGGAALCEHGHVWPASTGAWLYLVALALVSQVAGQGLIARALAVLPASSSSLTLLIQPVVATLGGWLVLGQSFGPSQAVASAAVILGIFIAARGRTPPARPAA